MVGDAIVHIIYIDHRLFEVQLFTILEGMHQLPQLVVVPAIAVELGGIRCITLLSIVYLVAAQLAVLALVAKPTIGIWKRM